MAIIATLLGGIIGTVSFLTAFFVLDASFLSASAIYLAFGLVTAALIIMTALIPTRSDETDAQPA